MTSLAEYRGIIFMAIQLMKVFQIFEEGPISSFPSPTRKRGEVPQLGQENAFCSSKDRHLKNPVVAFITSKYVNVVSIPAEAAVSMEDL